MPETITSLIEKLEGAGVGSRELDREVWIACGQTEKWGGPVNHPGKGVWEGPHVSFSLDAALALAERVLPGWGWSAGQGHGEKAYARLDTLDGCDFEEAYAATPALALCAAVLRARQHDN